MGTEGIMVKFLKGMNMSWDMYLKALKESLYEDIIRPIRKFFRKRYFSPKLINEDLSLDEQKDLIDENIMAFGYFKDHGNKIVDYFVNACVKEFENSKKFRGPNRIIQLDKPIAYIPEDSPLFDYETNKYMAAKLLDMNLFNVRYFSNLPRDVIKNVIYENAFFIIRHPEYETKIINQRYVQMFMVHQSAFLYNHIPVPFEETNLYMLTHCPEMMTELRNPTEKAVEICYNKRPDLILKDPVIEKKFRVWYDAAKLKEI